MNNIYVLIVGDNQFLQLQTARDLRDMLDVGTSVQLDCSEALVGGAKDVL